MTQIPFYDMKRQYGEMKPEIDTALQRVLDRAWFVLGEEGRSFENEFAPYLGAAHGVAVGSGTEALHLALVACGVQAGDEVITVPNTAVPTVNAISLANARPVFVDIDPATYNMDPGQLEAAITARTKAIVPVHLYGHPADLQPLLEIAHRYNLKVVEDASQAHGACYHEKKVGTFGHVGCFSFYPSKNLGCYGDGGFICTNDGDLAEQLRLLRNYGQRNRYEHITKGFNSRLDEIQAAILRTKLPHLDAANSKRRELAAKYDARLQDLPVTLPKCAHDRTHVFHLYVIRAPRRDELMHYLNDNEIGTIIHYPIPVHLQEAYRDLNIIKGMLPRAEQAAKEILSLPLYPEMTDAEVEMVAAMIERFYEGLSAGNLPAK